MTTPNRLKSSFNALMDNSSDAFALIDRNLRKFVAVNQSFSKMFGVTIENLNQHDVCTFYGISDNNSAISQLRNTANGEPFTVQVKPGNGEHLTIDLASSPIQIQGQDFLLLLNKLHVSEIPSETLGNLSSELAFDESEARWKAITDTSSDHIMIIDTNGIILYINHTVPNLTVEQVLGKCCFDFTPPDQIALQKEKCALAIKTGESVQFDTEYHTGDTTIFFDNRVEPIIQDDQVIALTVTCRDVTDRVKALKQVEKSQQHLHHALKAGKTGTWEWDMTTNEVTWSEGVEAIFGMEPGSFQRSYDAFKNIVHPDDLPGIESAIVQAIENDAPYYVEYRHVSSNGFIQWLSGQAEVYRDQNGKPLRMIGTVTDITERKLADAALQESQQKLTMHLQNTPMGVIDWNTNFEVLDWNPAAESIFGFTREEALGKSAFDLIVHSSLKPRVDDIWNALITRTGGNKSTSENITKDGRTIVCEWYNTPLLNNEGKVIGVSSLLKDVTERVQAQNELEKHRLHLEEMVAARTEEIHAQALMIDQIHDSVVSTDLDGFVTSWNKGAERIYGYKADEAIGQHISFVYPEDQHDFLRNEIILKLKEKGEFETEVITQRKSGERFYILLSLSVTHDLQGNVTGLIGYAIDITERKIAEEKILQQQIALEGANKELEAFSYSVSHDLRAPLRAIDGFSAELLDNYYHLLDDQGKDYFQRIRHSAQRMAALIDDLLQLSRISRHQLQKEIISLSLLAEDIVHKYIYENPERTMDIEIEDNLKVEGDPGLLRIALDNLISNAWKYTTKAEAPKIQIFQTQADGRPTFCIKDNGVGFDMRYGDKLFAAFQRLHDSEEFAGNGIGLATVSRIINRHGGKIWAKGTINSGASFYFTLS